MSTEAELRAYFATAALRLKFEGQNTDPDADHPRVYWCLGRGAVRISWGYQGDFERCTALVGKYVDRPEALCAQYHYDTLGSWPKESVVAAKPALPAEWDFDAETVEDALPPSEDI
ncbi:hypothetical protein [Rhodococcus sp. H29-C3]|uniref:hypothetical protein n=1 Tax=Rhodococcus sp. H29-C3 TaxID=3046307 RepID=UPI0024B8AA3C|nr:hypothetical protein [Rhodococcus sp. H29-C3]MDJ0361543.1 hypothetical protein [Rhodococcus sp. H29-C3]